jgi:hypothetical protein
MSAIQTLIDQTLSYASEATNNKQPTLAECYMDDWNDFLEIQYLLSAGYTQAAGDRLDEMDTSPREDMIMAILADYDHDMLENLGFALL